MYSTGQRALLGLIAILLVTAVSYAVVKMANPQ